MVKKFIAIYSVGTNGTGIDDLEDGKKGIFIYENSDEDLLKIKQGDIVCLIITGKQKVYLFEYNKTEGNYIILPKNYTEYDNITIGEFKNLYFLNFDNFKSWVRSPLATKRNILIFDNKNDILSDFINLDKLKEVFVNVSNFTRKYLIGDYSKLEDNKNIYLSYNNGKFGKEYSTFSVDKDGINNELTNKTLKQALNEIENRNSLKILEGLKNENEYVVNSYSGYYDLSRSFELSEVEENIKKSENKIKEIEEKIKDTTDESIKEELISQKEKEETVLKEGQTIEEEMKNQELRGRKIVNDDSEASLIMKKNTFIIINKILLIELFIVILIFILVGFGIMNFTGNELSIFIGATLTQIMLAFNTIVKSLFNK